MMWYLRSGSYLFLLAATLPLVAAEDDLPEGARVRFGSNRLRHGSTVTSLTWSPDGKFLASSGMDRAIHLWDAATGKLVLSCGDPRAIQQAGHLCFSPDGKFLASTHPDCDARIWDVATGKIVGTPFAAGGQGGNTLAWSPDGKQLLCGTRDGSVRLWSIAEKKAMLTLKNTFSPIVRVAFSPSGDRVFAVVSDQTLKRWDAKTGQLQTNPPLARDGYWYNAGPNLVAFSPDMKLLAGGGANRGGNSLWTIDDGKSARPLTAGYGPAVHSVSFSGDSRFLALASSDGRVAIRGLATDRELRTISVVETARTGINVPMIVAFSPDSRTLAVAHTSRVLLYDVAGGKPKFEDQLAAGAVASLAFLDSGRRLVVLHQEGVVNAWDAVAGKHVERMPLFAESAAGIQAVADGKAVRAWTLSPPGWIDWEPNGKTRAHGFSGSWMRPIPPDGRTIVRLDLGPTRLFDLEDGKDLRPLIDPPMTSVSTYSPDGLRLAGRMQSNQGVWSVWDIAGGRPTTTFAPSPTGPDTYRAAFLSPRGRMLAQVSAGLQVWETASARVRLNLPWTAGVVTAGVFSSDGRSIVLGTMTGEVIAVDLDAGKELVRRQGHRGPVRVLRFSTDGAWLASGSEDSTTIVWKGEGFLAKKPPVEQASPELAAKWWDDLGAEDPAKAVAALRGLGNAPTAAVTLLKTKLEPIKEDRRKRVDQLIEDLDAKSFRTREKATKALAEMGQDAREAMEKALAKGPPPEAKRRLEELLQQVKSRPQEGRVRTLRAIEALERAGTPEAIDLLKTLAAGDPEAWLTREAKLALAQR